MPIYFNDVAPFCPLSRDQPTGPMTAPTIRTSIPRAHDLPSAIAAVNILRSIVIQMVFNHTRNNVSVGVTKPRKQPQDRTIDKRRYTRWVEKKELRIKRRYIYYGKDESSPEGKENQDVWVVVERIERMVWEDKGWKTHLEFKYGDKGEGKPLSSIGGGLETVVES